MRRGIAIHRIGEDLPGRQLAQFVGVLAGQGLGGRNDDRSGPSSGGCSSRARQACSTWVLPAAVAIQKAASCRSASTRP